MPRHGLSAPSSWPCRKPLERVDIAIVGHGGTGTLLYCHLARVAIDRRYDQPATNGGNWFTFDRGSRKLPCDAWQSIDAVAVSCR
jgi:broad specificity phosphatase PhoE